MAKKKDIIMEKLGDLKPGIPTKTRAETIKVKDVKKDTEIIVQESETGQIDLISENIELMEQIREALVEEIEKINLVVIDTWQKTMSISYNIFSTNFDYILNIIKKVTKQPSDK